MSKQAALQQHTVQKFATAQREETAGGQAELQDNRPAVVAQRQLAAAINSSPKLLQQKAVVNAVVNSTSAPAQMQQCAANRTGLPNQLKAGVEALSGMSMDHVKVHYNSSKPAQLNALAYAQGSEIHVGPGQEKHLPHEAWHVVQQAQGRVKPTMQMAGVEVNDDGGLEHEADVMGSQAQGGMVQTKIQDSIAFTSHQPIQRAVRLDVEGTPNPADIVHIVSIDRIATPSLDFIPGKVGSDAARHIIPSALLQREFKARYNGKTVAALQADFPSVALDNDFQVNLAAAMWQAFTYEDRQLNAGSLVALPAPEGTTDIADREELPELTSHAGASFAAISNRNYWAGSQAANLAKDAKATSMLASADTDAKKIKALAEEFDPPPFATQNEIKEMAAEWARLTNSWLANDLVSRAQYWPGRDLVAADAYKYGENKKIFDKKNKRTA